MTNGVDDIANNGANGGASDGFNKPCELTNGPPPGSSEIRFVPVSSNLMPDKFDGKKSFKSWQKKMQFFLHNLNLTKYLTEVKPVVSPDNTDPRILVSVEAWVHGDYTCKGHILHCLVEELYDVYCEVNTSKCLWETLERKYKVFNVGSGKFATATFLNYKMVDSRPIMEQVHELQLIFQGIADEGMKVCETFTVNSIVEKLPPSWGDFKNYLEFKQKSLSLQNLVSRLQNESNKRNKLGLSLLMMQMWLSTGKRAKVK